MHDLNPKKQIQGHLKGMKINANRGFIFSSWLGFIAGLLIGFSAAVIVLKSPDNPLGSWILGPKNQGLLSMHKSSRVNVDGGSSKNSESKNSENKNNETKPKYDFYTLLPENEVVVDTTTAEANAESNNTPLSKPDQTRTPEQDAAKALALLNDQPNPDRPKSEVTNTSVVDKPISKNPVPKTKPTPPPNTTGTQIAVTQPGSFFLQAGSFRNRTDADRVRNQIVALGQSARIETGVVRDDTWYRVMVGPFSQKQQVSDVKKRLSASGFNSVPIFQR